MSDVKPVDASAPIAPPLSATSEKPPEGVAPKEPVKVEDALYKKEEPPKAEPKPEAK